VLGIVLIAIGFVSVPVMIVDRSVTKWMQRHSRRAKMRRWCTTAFYLQSQRPIVFIVDVVSKYPWSECHSNEGTAWGRGFRQGYCYNESMESLNISDKYFFFFLYQPIHNVSIRAIWVFDTRDDYSECQSRNGPLFCAFTQLQMKMGQGCGPLRRDWRNNPTSLSHGSYHSTTSIQLFLPHGDMEHGSHVWNWIPCGAMESSHVLRVGTQIAIT
jgi:hypothetical protein